MSKELTELKNIADSFFAKAEAFVKTIKAQEASSDQHLLDDGLIRHTGDACPVHELDEVIYRVGKDVSEMSFKAGVLNWNNTGITHYKITKKYDPQPKKQLIDWSHPYFKGCATNWGELRVVSITFADANVMGNRSDLRLAAPANDHANWQPFFSTPENDAKLRELAKMVKVEVRYWDSFYQKYVALPIGREREMVYLWEVCNYRITGECQDGRTDNPKEAQSC